MRNISIIIQHSLPEANSLHSVCKVCNFGLYLPIASLRVSHLGLYNDSRFPGRCLLVLNEHYESLENLPQNLMVLYMEDVKQSINAIKLATGSERVNLAILGNREPHVHSHLIPRYPAKEEFPDCSPWNDKRFKETMPEAETNKLLSRIAVRL